MNIRSLHPGDRLTFLTRNSVYRVVLLNPETQTVIIRGGRHFQTSTEATLMGTTDGVRRHAEWIECGRRLEVAVGNRHFVTSNLINIERA